MQLAMHMVTIEDLMPREHFLRKLEAALDLSFVYEETAPLYSKKYGRPPIDPVVIGSTCWWVFCTASCRSGRSERRVQTDIALRWYLGLTSWTGCRITAPSVSGVPLKPSFRRFPAAVRRGCSPAH